MASGGAAERARLAHERLSALDASAAREAEQMLAGLHEQRAVAEAELSSLAGGREGAAATLLRLRSARERLDLRHESAAALVDGLRQELDEAKAAASGGPDPAELEREATEAAAAARLAATERDDLRERARAAGERLAALELSLAEREGIPPAARALAESGERLALSLLDAEPGTERAIAAALGSRASAVLADDASAGFALLERARAAGLGSLTVLIGADPSALVASLPVVPASELLAQTAPAVTAEGFGYDPGRGELWFAGETAEAVLLEQDARRRALAEEKESLSVRAAAAAREADASAARAERAEAAYAAVAHLRSRHADPPTLARLLGGADSLVSVLTASIATAERLEGPIRIRADEQARGAADLGERLRPSVPRKPKRAAPRPRPPLARRPRPSSSPGSAETAARCRASIRTRIASSSQRPPPRSSPRPRPSPPRRRKRRSARGSPGLRWPSARRTGPRPIPE